jgi:hypothetical protein
MQIRLNFTEIDKGEDTIRWPGVCNDRTMFRSRNGQRLYKRQLQECGTDIKRLFARSGNCCAFAKCTSPIAEGDTLIGEAGHIEAASPDGPRYNPAQTPEERHTYDNLILHCPTHHTVIDHDDETYTVERHHKMKADHEARVKPVPEQQATRIAELFVQQGLNIDDAGSYCLIASRARSTMSFGVA